MTDEAPHPRTGRELAARLAAERAVSPFLLFRDDQDEQLIVSLVPDRPRLTIGRDGVNDVSLPWDREVSRVHAELEQVVEGDWAVSDDGLSRNGTFVNGSRVAGRRRLRDGDCLRVGRTVIVFTEVGSRSDTATMVAGPAPLAEELTPMQRRILAALCRPLVDAGGLATPASNRDIAETVHLSVEGVKGQLRTLSDRFGVGELPQNQKRLELAERAFRSGLGRP